VDVGTHARGQFEAALRRFHQSLGFGGWVIPHFFLPLTLLSGSAVCVDQRILGIDFNHPFVCVQFHFFSNQGVGYRIEAAIHHYVAVAMHLYQENSIQIKAFFRQSLQGALFNLPEQFQRTSAVSITQAYNRRLARSRSTNSCPAKKLRLT
jgi:hypothetical protein